MIPQDTVRLVIAAAGIAAMLCGQQQPDHGARLILAPSEPLAEPRFPEQPKVQRETGVRPAILNLKPAGDPIHLVDQLQPDAAGEWKTYRVPRVDRISRDGEGVAMQGYDVLSYLNRRVEKGSKDFAFEHGGVKWLFANAGNRDEFGKDPERYMPEYGGFCAYSVSRGYPVTADPRVSLIRNSKLYVFFDNAARLVWEQDEAAAMRAADRNWPRLRR
jgi:hypothetical protein